MRPRNDRSQFSFTKSDYHRPGRNSHNILNAVILFLTLHLLLDRGSGNLLARPPVGLRSLPNELLKLKSKIRVRTCEYVRASVRAYKRFEACIYKHTRTNRSVVFILGLKLEKLVNKCLFI